MDGCAPGKATRQALEQAYAPDVFYQEAVNETFPRALVEAFGQEEILDVYKRQEYTSLYLERFCKISVLGVPG